jgi:transposase
VKVQKSAMEYGVRFARVWQRLLGVERTVVEQVEFDAETDTVVAHVRPREGARQRCGRCGRRGPWYDRGDGRRRWRALDLGVVQTLWRPTRRGWTVRCTARR